MPDPAGVGNTQHATPVDARPVAPAVDARLVAPAAGAWTAAWVAVAQPAGTVAVAAAAAAAVACALGIVLARGTHGLSGGAGGRQGRARGARPVGERGSGHGGVRGPRHRGPATTRPAATLLLVAAVTCAVLLSAAADLQGRQSGLLADLTERGAAATVTARVAEEPRPLGRTREWETAPRVRVVLQVTGVAGRGDSAAARAPVVLIGPSDWAAARLGELIRVRGTLAATPPGERPVAFLTTSHPPELLAGPPVTLRAVNTLRHALLEVTADLSPQARGLVPGIAVGDDRALPADLATDMRATALTHLTAVSGAHVAILLGAVLAATSWLPRRVRTALAALALVAFVCLVRPEPSVVRSAAMGTVVLLALLIGRPSRALPALAATVVALLVADPWLAREYGFALSVLATGGLVLLARPWARRLGHVLPRWLATAIAVPAAAQAACGPVVVLLTPALALYAVPANLLAAPAVPPATVLGVAATMLAPVWPVGAHALAVTASAFTWWIAAVATTFAGMPAAQLPWPGGPGGAVGLAVATGVVVVVLGRLVSATRTRATAGVVAVCLVVLAPPALRAVALAQLPDGWPPHGWVAIQCDVGQGAALVVRSGPGSAVMVDVGPEDGGARECLEAAGVDRLDLLVLTHAHADHVGGLPEVLAAADVAQVLLGPGAEPRTSVTAVLEQLSDAGVPVSRPVADDGAGGAAGDVTWTLLWPSARAVERSADAVNDLSLVVRLAVPGLDVVALGDVELSGQAGLLTALRAGGAPEADVVVMAHHGSARQDPDLATLLRPRLTLVSVGAGNDYGHPAQAALDLYAATGSAVLRTDRCGPVAVVGGGGGPAAVARCR